MTTRTAFAASLVATACAAATARADIVHFVNPAPGQPGHYNWQWGPPWLPGNRWLDITHGPADQPNTSNGSSVAQYGQSSWLDTFNGTKSLGAAVAVLDDNVWGRYTHALGPGDTLLASVFHSESTHYYSNSEQPDPPWGVSLFPEDERRYIGVLTADGRFGWIEVERTGVSLAAFSWAYETVPGVPIAAGQIPAPGAAVVLALGVLGVAARRRML
ncbi:MAG: hypothetical protein KF864_00080 [Phycisphaeraceae bacterium]|nr:hypothetical protein [Phycisphaeraceae bacterium]